MRGEAAAISSTFFTPSAGLKNGVDENGLLDGMARLELGEELVEIMDVPGALDLGQHDDVQLVADLADDLDDVVQHPRAVEAVDAGPQAGGAEIGGLGHLDEALASGFLGIGGNRVLQIAENHVHLLGDIRHLGAHLLQVRRHEMDHALKPHRQLAIWCGRADGERLEELARQLHESPPCGCRQGAYNPPQNLLIAMQHRWPACATRLQGDRAGARRAGGIEA